MRLLVLLGLVVLVGCASVRRAPEAPAHVWASFDGGGITDSGGEGLADRARARRLTIDDPVRIASITKLVVALGVMRLAEQGQLDLDRDVSHWLGWSLRNPAFPDQPITLRLLLSHRSSLQDEIDYAIPLGTALRTALVDPRAFDSTRAPGTYFRYSNLNFPIVASVMELATGERFDRLMARLVLQPLELDACFNWTTCSDDALARAVVLYDGEGRAIRDDLNGRPPECPVLAPNGAGCDLASYVLGTNGALFSPQGGLRISVRDLTVIGRLLLNVGRHGSSRFLGEESIREIMTPAWRFDGGNGDTGDGFYCAYGLAVHTLPLARQGCRDDLSGNGRTLAGHAGDAYGVLAGLWIDPDAKVGIAYFSTGNGDAPPRGASAFRAIEERLARNLRVNP